MEETRNEVKLEKRITNKDLMKVWWRWVFFQEASVSYERLQAPGFFYAISPVLVKLYGDNPEELTAACKRHMQFYNSEPYCGLAIHGITLALEEERANGAPISDEAINSLKTGLMGPLAGLGDSVRAGTIAPIVTAFCISIGQTGNLIAPFLLEGILVAIVWPFAIWLLKKSYHTGKEGIQEIFSSGKLNWITTMTSTLGGITLGALAASYVTLTSPLEFVLGKGSKIALQADVLDVILKNILPLSMVLLSVYLLNKKVSAVKIILILAAICALGVLIGIF
ncbi:PTS system mannose/fructose/sorbose family transporter subunit IID [[Clostridium] innocuum]|nr:PTS system mannose/fructose/sorbose family transporter subunit IID [Erysipelotrichaceae bacterium]MCR0381633.1 PTS system mannose/fructose/sorbose family transporter subunit IID [[Clostridium] innocuum]MCR0412959.1 PTS system mannose/fructose/sorbose family transporter subunit IID [[Clostridium] innocuum]MCR0535486.1 PTS system mannose/fructose/sorbose family transporter subunit IID [[Clostridium] innocuum]MCR0539228.1 PTS system mannose/fructose/sorbose family transporter subunit IID [[Clos